MRTPFGYRGALCRLSFVAALLALAIGVESAAAGIWIELETPADGARLRGPVGLVEVRGRAGVGVPGQHDVVLLIDRSVSTFAASGLDVNRNGRVGHNVGNLLHPVLWTTDFGDTIISAQLAAARGLIERLDPQRTRMGLVTFGGSSQLRAPVGSDREQLLAALDSLTEIPDDDGTYIYGAVMHAIDVLEAAPIVPGGGPRQRSIILLSDGVPTAPNPPSSAEKATLQAARRAAQARVTIYAFALGPEAAKHRAFFEQMTRLNGGELLLVDQPGEVVFLVPHLNLTQISELAVDNLSMSRSARALRSFPDGSFDAFAPLIPGTNRLRISAQTAAGTRLDLERSVHFEPSTGGTEAEARLARELLKTLEIRTLETELAAEARRRRRAIVERSLRIDVEPR